MRRILLIAAMLLIPNVVLIAQHSGPSTSGQGQQQGQAQPRRATTGSQSSQSMMAQTRQQQRNQLRSQATDGQREQYRTGNQSMERIRTQARDMARISNGTTFNADQARQQRDQLRDQVRTMDQQNQRLMEGLDNQQRTAVEQRTRTMNQLQERINSRLQNMDQELAKTSPDRKRIAEEAQNVERETQRYQQQYRDMGDDLNLRSPQS